MRLLIISVLAIAMIGVMIPSAFAAGGAISDQDLLAELTEDEIKGIIAAEYDGSSSGFFSGYKLDTYCKIAYVMEKQYWLAHQQPDYKIRIGYVEKFGSGFLPFDRENSDARIFQMPSNHDEAYTLTLEEIEARELWQKMVVDFYKKHGVEAEDIAYLPYERHQEIGELLMTKMQQELRDEILEFNSVDPKHHAIVNTALQPIDNAMRSAYTTFASLPPKYYSEDIECGKKLHAEFSDRQFSNSEMIRGADFAQNMHDDIKSRINAAATTTSGSQSQQITSEKALEVLDEVLEKVDEKLKPSGGGCLIATAAFGSEMAPQVQFLRELRDNTVLSTQSGTAFMTGFNQFYYSFSPAVADYERENPVFKEMVRVSLTPLLTSLTLLNYVEIDTEEEMLGYGIGIILLNVGMYFVAPAVLIIALKKRFL